METCEKNVENVGKTCGKYEKCEENVKMCKKNNGKT